MPLQPLPPLNPASPWWFPTLLISLPSTLPLSLALLPLAPLTHIPVSTLLHTPPPWLNFLILTPGMHLRHTAPSLAGGEYPACGALTTGYVFRVENEGTVGFLQRVGRTGVLTTLGVERVEAGGRGDVKGKAWLSTPTVCTLLAQLLTLLTLLLLLLALPSHHQQEVDVPALLFVFTLLTSSLLSHLLIHRLTSPGGSSWHGASEPNVHGDLLILLSRDRWIRLTGFVDDLKSVTSGSWLRQPTFLEGFLNDFATVLVYLSPGFAAAARPESAVVVMAQMLVAGVLVAVANEWSDELRMKGCRVRVEGRKVFKRRLDLVEDLWREAEEEEEGKGKGKGKKEAMKRCFVQMGMSVPGEKEKEKEEQRKGEGTGKVIM